MGMLPPKRPQATGTHTKLRMQSATSLRKLCIIPSSETPRARPGNANRRRYDDRKSRDARVRKLRHRGRTQILNTRQSLLGNPIQPMGTCSRKHGLRYHQTNTHTTEPRPQPAQSRGIPRKRITPFLLIPSSRRKTEKSMPRLPKPHFHVHIKSRYIVL